MVMITSQASATLAGVAAAVAPAATTGFTLLALRFQTVTVWPTSISRCAIAAPIMPRPATPTFMFTPCFENRRDDRRSRDNEKGLYGATSVLIRVPAATTRKRAMAAKGTVGVIGLGIMGGSFAQNLASAGWRVIGYDLDAKRARALAKAGVEIVQDAT